MTTVYNTSFKTKVEIQRLRKRVEDFESGELYLKITDEYEKKLAAKDRMIRTLEKRLALSDERCRHLLTGNEELKTKLFYRESEISRLKTALTAANEQNDVLRRENDEKDHELQKLKALLNTDGTNSGLPTSRTPLNKDKIRPNSRKNTGKPRGGVTGHQKAKMNKFMDDEITDRVYHPYDGNCPSCQGILEETGKTITKDETDIEIRTVKRRHYFEVYRCSCCGKEVHDPIPNNIKEENQYGPAVQATALSLMNSCNVPINKTGQFIAGITNGKIAPCDGYIAKLHRRAAKTLEQFREDLKALMVTQPILYWDDTVIMINKQRGCLRFYGNERIAWYAAHEHKDLEGIIKDEVLQNLKKDTYVMHDHNSINYNKAFVFKNLECNVHLIRDCQKVEQILAHSWAADMHELISATIHKRKELIRTGINAFSEDELRDFNDRLSEIIRAGRIQNRKDRSEYYGNDEFTLLNRIEAYRENYFIWIEDFTLPATDSLSERALRGVKSKMKISGQFFTAGTADYYAVIKSYIETCHRNGINEIDALQRLASGKPYTVKEIFQLNIN